MASAQGHDEINTVDVHKAKELLSSGHKYLDVRTIEEFQKSHVENAINIPYMFFTSEGKVKNPEFLDKISSTCSKEDHFVVACNSGGRARLACIDLQKAGYANVTNMGGGYSAWVDNGLAGGDKPAQELKTACKFRP